MEEDGGWKSARKSVDKSLLKNIIRHTDAHNKIQEQNEMWKQWELKKQSQMQSDQSYKHDGHKRGYMRSDIELSSASKKESLKWNRLLMEYEEARNDRWGHSGYKELYPEEFQRGNSSERELDQSDGKEIKKGSSSRKKKKEKKEKLKKLTKVKSDSPDSDVKTGRNRKRDAPSKKSSNDLRTSDGDSRVTRLDSKEKSQSKYIDNGLNSLDRKRKVKSDSGLKNGSRDRKRKSQNSDGDARLTRSDRKRNIDSKKCTRTVENSHSPKAKKKKRVKH